MFVFDMVLVLYLCSMFREDEGDLECLTPFKGGPVFKYA